VTDSCIGLHFTGEIERGALSELCFDPDLHAMTFDEGGLRKFIIVSKHCAITSEFMSTAVKPGDDFYLFVNQKWLESHPIPEDKSAYGAFTEVQDRTEERLHQIVERVTASPKGDGELKIATFFRLGMMEERIEGQGIEGIGSEMQGITQIHDGESLLSVIGHFQILGIDPLFSLFAEEDPRDSARMIATLEQGGLGLPNNKYYLQEDEGSKKIRAQYRKYIGRMLSFTGWKITKPEEEAERILQLETRLACASFSPEENRDPERTYHKMNLQELQKQTPHIDWTRFLQTLGYPEIKEVNVHQPGFLQEVDRMVEESSLEEWQTFLCWKLLLSTAPFLDSRFVNETFRFYGTTLQGEIQIRARWKRVLDVLNEAMGEEVGKLYVREHFPQEAKEQVIDLISHIRKAFRSRIEVLSWMGPETRRKALEKLDAMKFKIGYPKKWRDYRMLEIREDSYLKNVLRAREFAFRHGPAGLDKAGKPVDPDVWYMTPQTVNAYYNPEKNEMVFPAAIFQPPFFSLDRERGMNYGAIGAVIGHEMTHGFDDTGRKFDLRGNLSDWWSPHDETEFTERAQQLVEQYSAYEALPGLRLNGVLTLGENIADQGGLTLAFHAFCIARGGEEPSIEELRQFFQGYARIWRENIREEALRQLVLSDPHAPTRFRVNGVVCNMDEFYHAYMEVGPDDALYRPSESRSQIW
jgi:putative endopeptidase